MKESLKILWFNWRCWLNPAMGGAEVFTHEVAKRWVALGHEVCLFTSQFDGCAKEDIVDGVKIVRAGGKNSVYSKAKTFYSKRFSKEGFDVVIDEINTQPFFAQKFAQNNEKVVALIHQLAREYWFYETPFPVSYIGYYFLENHWLKQYVDVPTVTVSESTKQDLAALGFKDVTIVPEGLNFQPLTTLPMKDSKPVAVFSGRLKRAKRPEHAIETFKIVKEKLPDAELWIFGAGPLKHKLQKMAGQGVRFYENLSNDERRGFLAKSWVLIVPGIREGWGLNIIEANALGVPAVAYNVPGLCDSVKDQKTGLLAESGNIKDLADKTINILTDKPLRERLTSEALAYSREFSWEKTADEFMKRIKQ
jgi:glycosyltransferase involved in cell wall biosynthesis